MFTFIWFANKWMFHNYYNVYIFYFNGPIFIDLVFDTPNNTVEFQYCQ